MRMNGSTILAAIVRQDCLNGLENRNLQSASQSHLDILPDIVDYESVLHFSLQYTPDNWESLPDNWDSLQMDDEIGPNDELYFIN